jgi:putative hemolysin
MILTIASILFIVVLLILTNALYVAGEFSAVSARRSRIVQLAAGGNRFALALLPIIQKAERLDHYIAASQVGITLSSIALGIYGERQIAPLVEPWIARLPFGRLAAAGIASILVLMVLTTLQVILGELVPKSLAVQYPERVAMATVLPVRWSADFLLRPLIAILNGSGTLILRLLGIDGAREHTHIHSPEEILILLRDSHRGGLVDADERQFLQRVFRTGQTHVNEVAIPRPRIVAAQADQPVAQVLRLTAESAFTRIPIYERDIDDITGFVHLRDLFTLYRQEPEAGIRSILREAPFVPETLTVGQVWERLDETGSYLAIVFDEYGGTSGLVTREDLVEEIFGEIQDEFDIERALVTPAGEGQFVVRGDILIPNLNDILEIDLPDDRASTVGGLIMEELSRVPAQGDTVVINSISFRVEAVVQNSVTAVRVTLPSGGSSLPGGETS